MFINGITKIKSIIILNKLKIDCSIEETTINDWEIKIIDALGAQYPVEPDNLKIITFSQIFKGLYGIDKKWYSQGLGCSRVQVDWQKGFRVSIKKSLREGKKDAFAMLEWGLE